VLLDLGEVGETAELWINGEYVGYAITNPYQFDVTGLLTEDVNAVKVEVVTNQAYRLRDMFSTYMVLPAAGIQGPVVLKVK